MTMTITSGTVAFPRTCCWCGLYHTGICPKATAIAYYPDGQIKRIEFMQYHTASSDVSVVYQWRNGKLCLVGGKDGEEISGTLT